MTAPNQAQIDLWSGRVGEKWAALQGRMDAMLLGATNALSQKAGAVAGLRVLDIGCGSGLTCEVWLRGGADVVGVDVSTPMLAVAASRTGGQVKLIEADASTWRSDQPFDLAVSQFGVMFFDDPEAAFKNIAANIKPGGRILFACWRTPAENPWATAPLAVVRDLLGLSPPEPVSPPPPGPFAFADMARLEGLVAQAGFEYVTIRPFDFQVRLAGSGGLDEAVDLLMQIGPASQLLAEAGEEGEEARKAAPARFETLLAPLATSDGVTMDGAIWLVEARRPKAS